MPKDLQWQRALQIFAGLQDGEASPALWSAAISACKTSKQWAAALDLLADLRRGAEPGPTAYGLAVGACKGAGRWEWAAELLLEMERSGLEAEREREREWRCSRSRPSSRYFSPVRYALAWIPLTLPVRPGGGDPRLQRRAIIERLLLLSLLLLI